MNIFNNIFSILYLVGFVMLVNGATRHMTYLKEYPIDDVEEDKLRGRSMFWGLPIFIGGILQFTWWYPLFAYAVSFLIGALFVKIWFSFDTPKLNKALSNFGVIISIFSLIGNQIYF